MCSFVFGLLGVEVLRNSLTLVAEHIYLIFSQAREKLLKNANVQQTAYKQSFNCFFFIFY
jgi:hypothetical protein